MNSVPSGSVRGARHPSLRVVIPPERLGEKIVFHEKCGKNIVLINDCRTAYRKNPEDGEKDGVVFTSRPLLDNELFEVEVDEIINQWSSYYFGIGITVQIPTDDLQEWLHDFEDCAWYMYGNSIYRNGEKLIEEYGRDMPNLEMGDRVGVMKKDYGDLHFFLNDEDMGPSVCDLPGGVYGVIDIGGCTVRASIMGSSTPLSR